MFAALSPFAHQGRFAAQLVNWGEIYARSHEKT